MTAGAARETAEAVARRSYGRLVALVTARTRDIAAAEDALADAFAAALATWPERGVPDNPEAWLVVAARRAAGKRVRHGRVAEAGEAVLALLQEERSEMESAATIPDDRLKLMFACAHPAIDPGVRTGLMLQTVLGLDAVRIGVAFAEPAATVGQRLVRAKAKIRDAGIPFRVPEAEDLPARLGDVLDAIYVAYSTGWERAFSDGEKDRGLSGEALWLGRLVTELLPAEPEPKGLLALMLYCEARRAARRDAAGRFVPLAAQDRDLWDEALVIEAEGHLRRAAVAGRFGRFQTEAAIQSVQVQAPRGQEADPVPLVLLYDLLARFHPVLGVRVARAVAHARRDGPEAGLRLLDEVADDAASYQPYWAARLDLARAAGRIAEAEAARERAAALSPDPAVADWLRTR